MRRTRAAALVISLLALVVAPFTPAHAGGDDANGWRRPVTQSHFGPGVLEEGVVLECTSRGRRLDARVSITTSTARADVIEVLTDGRESGEGTAFKSDDEFVRGNRLLARVDMDGTPVAVWGRLRFTGPARLFQSTTYDNGLTPVAAEEWRAPLRAQLHLSHGRKHAPLVCRTAYGYAIKVDTTP